MARKKLYRTVIEIEVLSKEPIPDDMSLDDIQDECYVGSYSGVHDWKVKNEEVEGEEAVKLVLAQGSSPDFFSMDENGNDLDSENDEDYF